MEPKSFSQLLGKLADALKKWAGKRYDRHDDLDGMFDKIVHYPRLDVLVRLGAEQRGYLAELIDASLNRVKESARKFVDTALHVRPGGRRPLGYRVFIRSIQPAQTRCSVDVINAAEELYTELCKCDELFQQLTKRFGKRIHRAGTKAESTSTADFSRRATYRERFVMNWIYAPPH